MASEYTRSLMEVKILQECTKIYVDRMDEEAEEATSRSCSSIESIDGLDWDGLVELCREKEEQLNLAGACGLKLHEQLMETQAHIDEMRTQHDTDMERLQQEVFELRSKLDAKEKALVSQENEFEEYQKLITKKHEQDLEEMQETLKKELRAMKKEKDSSMAELVQIQLRAQQSNEKVSSLEKKVQDLQSENMQKVKLDSSQNNSELYETHEKIFFLEELNTEINDKLSELQRVNQTLELELSSKKKQCEEMAKETEEIEMRCTTYFNHLQQAREEKTEIKTELDLLKAEQRNSGHKKSGNSLFSEVEDQRIEMEKKLLSMQVKYESLLKAYNFVKNQLHTMKTQVFALLQVKNAKADEDHISRLERALSQAKSENNLLTSKLKMTEEKQNLSKEDIAELAKNLPEFKRSQDLVDFLYGQIEEYKTKMETLQKDYDQIYMVKLAESDKLHSTEQRLYESTVQAEATNQSNMRLRLKLEETKNKLEAEIQKRKLVEKKFNYDSSSDIVPMGMIGEEKKVKRQPLPYTLTKAKEKEEKQKLNTRTNSSSTTNNVKNKFSTVKGKESSLLTGMEWHKLPKEILDELGIAGKVCTEDSSLQETKNSNPKTVVSNKREEENVSTKCKVTSTVPTNNEESISSEQEHPRRVSFKDTPETIPSTECLAMASDENHLLTSTMLDDDVIGDENPCMLTPTSKTKGSFKMKGKTLLSPLKDATNSNNRNSTEEKPIEKLRPTSAAATVISNDIENPDCKVQ